eukprot:165091-Chlamydomonas_euryale.AAC.1
MQEAVVSTGEHRGLCNNQHGIPSREHGYAGGKGAVLGWQKSQSCSANVTLFCMLHSRKCRCNPRVRVEIDGKHWMHGRDRGGPCVDRR